MEFVREKQKNNDLLIEYNYFVRYYFEYFFVYLYILFGNIKTVRNGNA